jgi:hypothetical protein
MMFFQKSLLVQVLFCSKMLSNFSQKKRIAQTLSVRIISQFLENEIQCTTVRQGWDFLWGGGGD